MLGSTPLLLSLLVTCRKKWFQTLLLSSGSGDLRGWGVGRWTGISMASSLWATDHRELMVSPLTLMMFLA